MQDTLAKCIIEFEIGLNECRRSEDRTLISTYLATLAPLLAKATTGLSVPTEVEAIERLFCNTWLIDEKPFLTAFGHWQQFKNEVIPRKN